MGPREARAGAEVAHAAAAPPSVWEFDAAHSTIAFLVRHMVVSRVRGELTRWSGRFVFDERAGGAAEVEVRIDAASVDTREPCRDQHLRSADFLDVERYPFITFRSTRVERVDARRLMVIGDLTIRGVRRDCLLSVEYNGSVRDPEGRRRAGFSARASLDRKAFGISFNQVLDTGGVVIGDRVEVAIEIEAVERGS